MSTPSKYKSDKFLRVVTVLTFTLSAFEVLYQSYHVVRMLFSLKNPLIPKYVAHYAAFPSYVLIPVFVIISWIGIRILSVKKYNFKVVYSLFVFVVLFFVFRWKIHEILMSFNPFGS